MRVQEDLARAAPEPWRPAPGARLVGGCFVCFRRGAEGPGRAGEPAWAAAAVLDQARQACAATRAGRAGAAYQPGLLALRAGPLLAAVVRGLAQIPAVLLVDATGRDHPRRAGLALHLGAVLGIPTIGVTHRPLLARGPWPPAQRGAWAPLILEGEPVGAWVRPRAGARPVAVHAAWRTDVATGVAEVLAVSAGARTPEPLRRARRLAKAERSRGGCGA
ncbi:MAG TPA: endonuclease V [Miltoncostaeaceae bacterium]|nr:endonuclease V [Miltoncostaeaceae bacterium]